MQSEHEAEARALFWAIDPRFHFNRLFDHLRGTHFFAKDLDGRIWFASSGLARLYGFDSEAEFIGRTDFDVLPPRLAEKFRQDDLRVAQTGRPMIGIVELFPNQQGIPDWYLTHKIPLPDPTGAVIGVAGVIVDHRAKAEDAIPVTDMDKAVAWLRRNSADDSRISDVARRFGLSPRQFETKFRESFSISPTQFRIRLRVMRACELLRETELSVSEVAIETGFYDQSALSHHLKETMGYTPLQYRKRYTG